MTDIDKAIEYIARKYFNILMPHVDIDKYPSWLERIKKNVNELREAGFSSREIIARINEAKKLGLSGDLIDLFTNEEKAEKTNLIKDGSTYYHNYLKVIPPAPRFYYDPDMEEFVTEFWNPEKGRYTLEYYPTEITYKKKFTVIDLLEYFYSVHHITNSDRNRDIGAMNYLLSIASLDEILFTIDYTESKKLRSAIQLQQYLDDGREYLTRAIELNLNSMRENKEYIV